MKKLLFCIITLIMMFTNIAFANPLTLNEAKNNALKFFSLENKSITWVKEKQEFEKKYNYTKFEFEFIDDITKHEYEIEIDVNTGEIIKYSCNKEKALYEKTLNNYTSNSDISLNKVKEIITNDLTNRNIKNINSDNIIIKIDKEDNRYVYEAKYYVDFKEYKYKIDKSSGNILKFEID